MHVSCEHQGYIPHKNKMTFTISSRVSPPGRPILLKWHFFLTFFVPSIFLLQLNLIYMKNIISWKCHFRSSDNWFKMEISWLLRPLIASLRHTQPYKHVSAVRERFERTKNWNNSNGTRDQPPPFRGKCQSAFFLRRRRRLASWWRTVSAWMRFYIRTYSCSLLKADNPYFFWPCCYFIDHTSYNFD